jgi:O-antigen ligase
MELFLLNTFALLRPLLSIEVGVEFGGIGLFDLAGMGFIAVLALAFFVRISLGGQYVTIRSVDTWMIAYMFWCVAVSLIYPDKTDFRELIKWIVPFMTYIVAAKILRDRREYLRLLSLLMIGHVIPILASAVVIFLNLDLAIRKVVGATGLPKYEGVYANSGNLGLSMTLFVILGVIYADVTRSHLGETKRLDKARVIFFILVTLFALYCLLSSQSRTAQLGLVIFFAVYLYQVSKKWLLIGAAMLGVFVVIMSPLLTLMYYDVIRVQQGERPIEELGSGRPYFWMHNLSEFSEAPPDRLLTGVGIGNLVPMGSFASTGESIWSSHNDFLAVLVHTGIIGLIIFLGLQVAILKKILAIEGHEKTAFLALFFAVTAMNFASNSYISRFALAQIYFLVLAYIEFARAKVPADPYRSISNSDHKNGTLV